MNMVRTPEEAGINLGSFATILDHGGILDEIIKDVLKEAKKVGKRAAGESSKSRGNSIAEDARELEQATASLKKFLEGMEDRGVLGKAYAYQELTSGGKGSRSRDTSEFKRNIVSFSKSLETRNVEGKRFADEECIRLYIMPGGFEDRGQTNYLLRIVLNERGDGLIEGPLAIDLIEEFIEGIMLTKSGVVIVIAGVLIHVTARRGGTDNIQFIVNEKLMRARGRFLGKKLLMKSGGYFYQS